MEQQPQVTAVVNPQSGAGGDAAALTAPLLAQASKQLSLLAGERAADLMPSNLWLWRSQPGEPTSASELEWHDEYLQPNPATELPCLAAACLSLPFAKDTSRSSCRHF